ncbi:hypothetical protein [Glycomyces salinus]|uniref:hypothetical protein n=1 Tax=Glycomyces salinus TaxID=980294 RepID=UPI0018ECA459|nr:hypothetical protein [Glycomyces salinus]
MTIRSRLWASLAVALAMVLAAGLATADPAAAGPDDADLTAAEAAELGAVLNVQYESQPDGYIKITEYENAYEVTGVAAACTMTTRAYKPRQSGSRIRGTGYYELRGCGSSPFEVIISIEIYVNGYWLSRHSWSFQTYPPISGEPSISTSCDEGNWSTELFVRRGNNEQYTTSSVLNVSSC